jgi:putative endonuclease
MKLYYTYIVKCSDDSYYTGITNNVERRLMEHNNGILKSAYTYNKRPVVLVWYETFTDVQQAILFEKQIKGWSRRKKEALIKEDWKKLVLFSRNYTEYDGSSTSSD